MRGLAALVVVVHHSLLTSPAFADEYLGSKPGSRAWWFAYTPLHLFWAGSEAVLVFFVLSGLVLSRPMVSGRPGTWRAYYPRRMVRLYAPVGVAVVITGVVVAFFPRVADPARSWWFNAHAVPDSKHALLHDAFLLDGTGWLNSALWSLRYEVLFSLLLPLFVVLVRGLSVPPWLSVPFALWGIGWAASIGHELLSYMFVFAVGVLLARGMEPVAAACARLSRSRFPRLAWTAFGGVSVLVLLADWWMKLFVGDATLWLPVGRPAGVLGAALVVVLFLHCPGVRNFGNSRAVQWLGKVSFSLYLVHEPLVVSIASRLPASLRGLGLTVITALVVSLIAAALFYRLVEHPSHLLAGRIGRLAGRLLAPRPRPEPATAGADDDDPITVVLPRPADGHRDLHFRPTLKPHDLAPPRSRTAPPAPVTTR